MKSKVCILASYAESLLNLRGPLLEAMRIRGYELVTSVPACARTQARLERLQIRFVPLALEAVRRQFFGQLARQAQLRANRAEQQLPLE
jgi:hypothetical protein